MRNKTLCPKGSLVRGARGRLCSSSLRWPVFPHTDRLCWWVNAGDAKTSLHRGGIIWRQAPTGVWLGELSQCWREVSAVFCCAVSCSTLQGHPDRHLRFGVVQDGCGEEPLCSLAAERELECSVWSRAGLWGLVSRKE